MPFDGDTYDREIDGKRLNTLLIRVKQFLFNRRGEWFTLEALQIQCGGTEASISARLRDLRKPKFGSWTIERRRVTGGLFMYRMAPLPPGHQSLLFDEAGEPK